MIQGRSGASFLHEPLFSLDVSDRVGRKHFDRDGPIEMGIDGAVNDSHAALPKHGLDAIMSEHPTDHESCRAFWGPV